MKYQQTVIASWHISGHKVEEVDRLRSSADRAMVELACASIGAIRVHTAVGRAGLGE